MSFTEFRSAKDPESLLLFLWILGTFIFVGFVNWTISGRNILPMAPAVGIIIARKFRRIQGIAVSKVVLPLALMLTVSLLVTYSDYRHANEIRNVTKYVKEYWIGKTNVWFQGHWGFQYYLEEAGAKALNIKNPGLKSGDILITPSFGYNFAELNEACFDHVQKIFISPASDFNGSGAGFYSLTGPFPYKFGKVEPESYEIQRVR